MIGHYTWGNPYRCSHCGNTQAWWLRTGRARWVYRCTRCHRDTPAPRSTP